MQTPGLNKKGLSEYSKTRQEGDLDINNSVRNLLIKYQANEASLSAYNSNRFIVEGNDKIPAVQRSLHNRYWNMILMQYPDTQDLRFCLISDGEDKRWLELFEKHIIPFLVANKLPNKI